MKKYEVAIIGGGFSGLVAAIVLSERFGGENIAVPFFRDGFRKVVFSVIIMIIVLFFSKGIMGDKELSLSRIAGKFRRKKKAAASAGQEVQSK